ncbi:MAG: YraN family protein [Chitinophagales bacterium]
MATHHDLGKKGEELAKEFLISKGYSILARNYRIGRAEIDIIAFKDDILYFIEIKTRSELDFTPQDILTTSKQRMLTEAAEKYKELKNLECETYFSLVGVIYKNVNNIRFEHYEDIFY